MPSSQIERKLAAIMFTDIAGYTEQMSKDEAVAISLLNKKESVLKPLISKHNGTYVKSTGDGSLSYFNSAVDAATCAKRFQESIYDDKDLKVRVGVHLGETIFEKGDIHGDGVNIASRLESMAVEGGVFVSKEVHDQLTNQNEFEGVSLGLQRMKGVGRLIEVYGLKGDKLSEPKPSDYEDNKINKHSDKEVPSIAIIPFENKGKEEDVYYAYGISVDLISYVSSAGLIRVASKKQIDDTGDLPQDKLAKKLDVRYMANGELWRMGDMFQLSIELYDTKDKKVIWSDRWEENWDNLPTIKESLSDGLLKALDRKSTFNIKLEISKTEAYEFYLKGKYQWNNRKNIQDMEIAHELIKRAIELDENLIDARHMHAIYYDTKGKYKKALKIYKENLYFSEKITDLNGIAMSCQSIGSIYGDENIKNYQEALNYNQRALNIYKKINNQDEIGSMLNNLGNLYEQTGEWKKGLKYLKDAFTIKEKMGNKRHIANVLNNIGLIYSEHYYDNKSALDYQMRALELRKETGDKWGLGYSLLNIGDIYRDENQFKEALINIKASLEIRKEMGDLPLMKCSYNALGYLYFIQNNYLKAEKCFNEAILLGGRIDTSPSIFSHIYYSLILKYLNKNFDRNSIYELIKNNKNISSHLNYRLYEILKDNSFLETAYKQVQEKAANLEPDIAAKFLSYLIPKAIVEEWEKVLQQ